MNLSINGGQHHHPLTYLCRQLSIILIILITTHAWLGAPYQYHLYASTQLASQRHPPDTAITSQTHDLNIPYIDTTDPLLSIVHEEDIRSAITNNTANNNNKNELNEHEQALDQSFYNHPTATILDHKHPAFSPRSQALGIQTGSRRHDTLVGLFFSHNLPSSWWLSDQSRLTHSLGYSWLSTQVQQPDYHMNIVEKIVTTQTQFSYFPPTKLNWFLSATMAFHYQWIDLNKVNFYTMTNHQNNYQFWVLGSSVQTSLGYQHTFPRRRTTHSSKHTQKYFMQIKFITVGYYKLLLKTGTDNVNHQIFDAYQKFSSSISFMLPSANIFFGYQLAIGYYL